MGLPPPGLRSRRVEGRALLLRAEARRPLRQRAGGQSAAAGHRPTRALQRLRAVLFTADQAELLRAREHDAGLLVERRGFLPDGRAVEFSQSYYRGDIYDFVAELNASELEA